MPIRCSYQAAKRYPALIILLLMLLYSSVSLSGSSMFWKFDLSDHLPPLSLSFYAAQPKLLTQSNSTRALAIDATTWLSEPFRLNPMINYGTDDCTRIMLFATNVNLTPGENSSEVTAYAEDVDHRIYPLRVEYIDKLPTIDSIYGLHIRLNDEMRERGDVLVQIYVNGVSSNRVRIGIGLIGGGPPDATPPPRPTPTSSPTPSPIPVPDPKPVGAISFAMAVANLSPQFTKSVYYRFSTRSGTSLADSSGGSHTGALSGAVTLNQTSLLTGDSDPSALFQGGKITSTSFMPALTTGLSLSVLFQPTAWPRTNSRQSIIAVGSNNTSGIQTLAYQNSANVFTYSFNNTSGGTQSFVFPVLFGTQNLNRTYHVAVTHDFASKSVKFYLDGLLLGNSSYTADVRSSASQPVSISNDNVRGYIDEPLVIGDRVLTGTEVRSLMRASVGTNQSATEFYVSPSGSYRNPGTQASPIDLYTALRSGLAAPNQTYWLRRGTYNVPGGTPTNGFFAYAGGTAGNPIKYREYPGERAIIDGSTQPLGIDEPGGTRWHVFSVYADYAEYWDFEVTNSNPDTEHNRALSRPVGVVIFGDHLKFIGIWTYDVGNGFSPATSGNDIELHGCLIFNNGYYSNTGADIEPSCGCNPSGHGIYAENAETINRKLFKNTVIWGNADFGFHAFGTGAKVSGIDVDGMISFQNGIWYNTTRASPNFGFLGLKPMRHNTVKNSVAYVKTGLNGSNYSFGRVGDPHSDLLVTNNKSFGSGRVSFIDFSRVTFSNNLMIDTRPRVQGANNWYFSYIRPISYPRLDLSHGYDVVNKGSWTGTGNTYAGIGYSTSKQIWNEDRVSPFTFTRWKELTNIDSDATIRNTTSSPYTHPLVYYFPNHYKPGTGFVAVFNPPGAAMASIDLSRFGLSDGQRYEIRDVTNPFVNLSIGAYKSHEPKVSVSMTGTTVVTPIGYTIAGNAASRTSREFKTFMVILARPM